MVTQTIVNRFGERLVERSTLNALLEGLHRIRDNGGNERSSTGEFWFPPHIEFDGKSLKSLPLYTSRVQQLRRVQDFLSNMLYSIEDELQDVCELMHPLYLEKGLADLPDELLALILEFACENRGAYAAFMLGRVCKRFRQIVLRLPNLWATLNADMDEDACGLSLERSRNKPLSVFVHPPEDQDLGHVLEMIEAQANRWITCNAYVYVPHSSTIDGIARNLELPQLRSCHIEFKDYKQDHDQEVDELAFFETWRAPRLTELNLTGYIPMPMVGMSLTKLSLALMSPQNAIWSLGKLCRLLEANPALEDLSLAVTTVTEEAIGPINFPRLKSLSLGLNIIDGNWWPKHYKFFLKALTAPVLDTLSLHFIDTLGSESIDDFIPDDLEMDTSIFDSVVDLELKVRLGPIDYKLIWLILQKTPRLRHFTLDTSDFIAPMGTREEFEELQTVRAPMLETVLFRSCELMNNIFVSYFVKIMQKARGWTSANGVTKITLFDCRDVFGFEVDEKKGVQLRWVVI